MANRAGARRAPIYLALGIGAWYGLLLSGVHATLAGVLAALFVPARVRIVSDALAGVIRGVLMPSMFTRPTACEARWNPSALRRSAR